MPEPLDIRAAARADVPILLELIRGLAEYEKLTHLVEADEPPSTASSSPRPGISNPLRSGRKPPPL
jgi:hypothetical protein